MIFSPVTHLEKLPFVFPFYKHRVPLEMVSHRSRLLLKVIFHLLYRVRYPQSVEEKFGQADNKLPDYLFNRYRYRCLYF